MADGLPGHRELQLCEDPYGRIWIGGIGGIGIFDGAQLESIFRDDQWGLNGFQVNNITRSRTGTMWVATNESVQYLPPGAGRFTQSLLANGQSLKDILLLGETVKGDIIAVAENDVYRRKDGSSSFAPDNALTQLVQQTGKTMLLKWVKGNQWLMSSRSHTLLIDIETAKPIQAYNTLYLWCAEKVDDDHMLVGSFGRDTVSLLNMQTGNLVLVNQWPVEGGHTFGGYIGGIAYLGNHTYAMASRYYGVYMVHVKNRSVKRIFHSAADPYSIINSFCRTAFVSSSGTLFISSSGLSYTQVVPPFVASQPRMELENADTYDAFIHTFLQTAKNTLWIGGNNGLMRWNPEKQKGSLLKVFTKGNTQSPPRTVRSVISDSLGRIWVGTYGAGIALLQGESFKTFEKEDTEIMHQWPSNDTYGLIPDEHGSFWVATDGGPAHFNPYSLKGTGFIDHPILQVLNGKSCFYIMPASGKTWFALSSGLYAYDSVSNRLDTIYTTDSKATPVHSLASDGKGTIYAACFDGLRIFDEVTGKALRRLSRKDGLVNEQLMGVRIDTAGQVWLIGLQGIALYKPDEKKLQTFTVRDGVLRSDFRYNALYLAPDGMMYAGNDGFNYFNPYKIKTESDTLQVYTIRVQAADSIFNFDGKEIVCSPSQRTLQFNYLSADLRMGPYLEYRYKLIGLDTAFIYAGKQRMARYTNLKPGRYTFIAEASADGINWAASKPIDLFLKKSLWEHLWFRLTVVSLLLLLAYLSIKKYVANIKKSAEIKRRFESEIAEVRMNLLRSQMNPHFIFNSLNSINHFILSNDKHNASGYLTKFSRLMRLMLDNSRSEWVLLSNELKALELYIQLEAMRLNKSFTYHLHVADGIDTDTFIVPPLLMQPFIENAIWHGLMHRKDNQGALTIDVSEKDGRLLISMKDNGIGRQASAALQKKNMAHRKSHGIKITEERLRMVNEIYHVNALVTIKDLVAEDGEATGTGVVIEMDKAQA